MPWLCATLLAPENAVEALSDALLEAGAVAVDVQDAAAGTPAERPIFAEPGEAPVSGWQLNRVSALFETDARVPALLAQALTAAGLDAGTACSLGRVEDEDWVRLTQAQFSPVEVTPDFWIVPTWHEVPAAARRHIRLDPGLAFGTGTHATTRMCLRWMALAAQSGQAAWPRVLDYGCGSGILAIGAAKMGAADIVAVDIDPAAVESTILNAEANGVRLQAGLPDAAQGEHDLVLANILATPLKVLAPLLCAHVAPGGHLVLAGILERQVEELQTAYAPWVALQVADREDGWVLMTARAA